MSDVIVPYDDSQQEQTGQNDEIRIIQQSYSSNSLISSNIKLPPYKTRNNSEDIRQTESNNEAHSSTVLGDQSISMLYGAYYNQTDQSVVQQVTEMTPAAQNEEVQQTDSSQQKSPSAEKDIFPPIDLKGRRHSMSYHFSQQQEDVLPPYTKFFKPDSSELESPLEGKNQENVFSFRPSPNVQTETLNTSENKSAERQMRPEKIYFSKAQRKVKIREMFFQVKGDDSISK